MKNLKLKELEKKILFGNHTDRQWKEMEKELKELFNISSKEDIEEFTESGAGNLLAQIIEYMD